MCAHLDPFAPCVDILSIDSVQGQMTLSGVTKRDTLEARDLLPIVRSPYFDFVVEGELGPSPAARRRKRLEEQAGIAGEESRPTCTQIGFTACRVAGRETQWEASRMVVQSD
jgi:hypothetical protein